MKAQVFPEDRNHLEIRELGARGRVSVPSNYLVRRQYAYYSIHRRLYLQPRRYLPLLRSRDSGVGRAVSDLSRLTTGIVENSHKCQDELN